MAYTTKSPVSVLDFTSLSGGKNLTTPFTDSASAQNTAAGLFGVGYGDRGYGQVAPSLPLVVAGKSMIASDWASLRNVIATIASHQGKDASYLPPSSEFQSGASVKAENSTGVLNYDSQYFFDIASATFDSIVLGKYNIGYLLTTLDAQRFSTNSGASMSITANALNIVRTGTWGAASTGITAIATATFPSEDAARYFFNSGGEIRFVVAHPNGTSQDNNWNLALSSLGSIAFKANKTTRSGSVGTPADIGYYQLTTSNQAIVSGVIGSGAYSNNVITVSAKAASITGLNGAKGSQVIFTINLSDTHNTTMFDSCSGGTSVVFSHLKATSVLSGITSPTIAQAQTWT